MIEGLSQLSEPLDPMEGGRSMYAWLQLFQLSYAVTQMGLWRLSWPDGGPTLEQPALLVDMFDLIHDTMMKVSKANAG
jgi:hypothetical protein